jgi:hypothetical protein
MTAVWWLALAGLPVFQQPLPESPGEPAAFAVVAGRAALRMPCYAVVCPDAEWMARSRYTTLMQPKVPGTLPSLRAIRTSPLATHSYASLSAPTSPRDWVNTEASDVKVDTTFGIDAFRRPGTDLQLQVGTGYRLQPYTDYGTAVMGPIARGGVQFSQAFGDRAWLNQQLLVETGRRNTFVRQTVGVDILLQPQWTLQSRVEMNHDTAANDGKGQTDTQSSLNLRYVF